MKEPTVKGKWLQYNINKAIGESIHKLMNKFKSIPCWMNVRNRNRAKLIFVGK